MTATWAMVCAVRRDEDSRAEVRVQVELHRPPGVEELCWLAEALEADGLEYVTFVYYGDDGVYRGNAHGWRRCCKHAKWLCWPCSRGQGGEVQGSEWHEAPPRPSRWHWPDGAYIAHEVEVGRPAPRAVFDEDHVWPKRRLVWERHAVFTAVSREHWETVEVRAIVRLQEYSTVEHLCWFAQMLEAKGLEQVAFILREGGAVYRGDARGWRRVCPHKKCKKCLYWPCSPRGDVPCGEWHAVGPRPACWDELTVLQWDEWDPDHGWGTHYADYSPSEGRA
jgi:hypothetical protein